MENDGRDDVCPVCGPGPRLFVTERQPSPGDESQTVEVTTCPKCGWEHRDPTRVGIPHVEPEWIVEVRVPDHLTQAQRKALLAVRARSGPATSIADFLARIRKVGRLRLTCSLHAEVTYLREHFESADLAVEVR